MLIWSHIYIYNIMVSLLNAPFLLPSMVCVSQLPWCVTLAASEARHSQGSSRSSSIRAPWSLGSQLTWGDLRDLIIMGFNSDFMGFNGIQWWFYWDLTGFNGDFIGI
jgi:hypothetical protein